MLVASNGDILVTEMRAGRVTVLHPSSDGSRVAGTDVVTDQLIEFHRRTAAGGVAMTTVAYLAVSPEGRTDRHCVLLGDESFLRAPGNSYRPRRLMDVPVEIVPDHFLRMLR